eukprot:3940665-Rhodomonas_salina.5
MSATKRFILCQRRSRLQRLRLSHTKCLFKRSNLRDEDENTNAPKLRRRYVKCVSAREAARQTRVEFAGTPLSWPLQHSFMIQYAVCGLSSYQRFSTTPVPRYRLQKRACIFTTPFYNLYARATSPLRSREDLKAQSTPARQLLPISLTDIQSTSVGSATKLSNVFIGTFICYSES